MCRKQCNRVLESQNLSCFAALLTILKPSQLWNAADRLWRGFNREFASYLYQCCHDSNLIHLFVCLHMHSTTYIHIYIWWWWSQILTPDPTKLHCRPLKCGLKWGLGWKTPRRFQKNQHDHFRPTLGVREGERNTAMILKPREGNFIVDPWFRQTAPSISAWPSFRIAQKNGRTIYVDISMYFFDWNTTSETSWWTIPNNTEEKPSPSKNMKNISMICWNQWAIDLQSLISTFEIFGVGWCWMCMSCDPVCFSWSSQVWHGLPYPKTINIHHMC